MRTSFSLRYNILTLHICQKIIGKKKSQNKSLGFGLGSVGYRTYVV